MQRGRSQRGKIRGSQVRGWTAPPTPLSIGRIDRLPTSLMDTISILCDNPTDHYAELQNILLRSYSLNAAQKTVRLLNHTGLETNKPSVPMDQLIALKPDSLVMSSKSCFSGKCPDTWLLAMSTSFAAAKVALVSAMSLAHPPPRAVLFQVTHCTRRRRLVLSI
jgi:hypothetical protein